MGHVKFLGPLVLNCGIGIPAAIYVYNVSPYPIVAACGLICAISFPVNEYLEKYGPDIINNKELMEKEVRQLRSSIESIEVKESLLKSILCKFITFESVTKDRLPGDIIRRIGCEYFSIIQ